MDRTGAKNWEGADWQEAFSNGTDPSWYQGRGVEQKRKERKEEPDYLSVSKATGVP